MQSSLAPQGIHYIHAGISGCRQVVIYFPQVAVGNKVMMEDKNAMHTAMEGERENMRRLCQKGRAEKPIMLTAIAIQSFSERVTCLENIAG